MWKELIKNEIWYTDKFVDESLIDQILDKIKESETKVLDGDEQPHIISKSYYNYNHVKYNIREDKLVLAQVIVRLNEVLSKVYKPILIQEIDNKNVLQFTTKTFNSNSIYNVHTERRDIYGDFVFIHYLTDEEGGELVFPNEKMLQEHFNRYPDERSNWQEFKIKLEQHNQPVYLTGPLIIEPRRNSCVLMRVGSAHYVNPVKNAKENCRVVITGWPFANNEWRGLQNKNLRSLANSL